MANVSAMQVVHAAERLVEDELDVLVGPALEGLGEPHHLGQVPLAHVQHHPEVGELGRVRGLENRHAANDVDVVRLSQDGDLPQRPLGIDNRVEHPFDALEGHLLASDRVIRLVHRAV